MRTEFLELTSGGATPAFGFQGTGHCNPRDAPGIEWRKLAGLRDVLAHNYFGLEPETIWDIVTNALPPVAARLAPIISAEKEANRE